MLVILIAQYGSLGENGFIQQVIEVHFCGWIQGWMDGWMVGQICGWIQGRMDGWPMNGRNDELMVNCDNRELVIDGKFKSS